MDGQNWQKFDLLFSSLTEFVIFAFPTYPIIPVLMIDKP